LTPKIAQSCYLSLRRPLLFFSSPPLFVLRSLAGVRRIFLLFFIFVLFSPPITCGQMYLTPTCINFLLPRFPVDPFAQIIGDSKAFPMLASLLSSAALSNCNQPPLSLLVNSVTTASDPSLNSWPRGVYCETNKFYLRPSNESEYFPSPP